MRIHTIQCQYVDNSILIQFKIQWGNEEIFCSHQDHNAKYQYKLPIELLVPRQNNYLEVRYIVDFLTASLSDEFKLFKVMYFDGINTVKWMIANDNI